MEKIWDWCLSWGKRLQNRATGNADAEIGYNLLIMDYKWLVNTPAGDSLHILHHCARTVQGSEMVTKELLGPAMNNSLRTRIIKNGFG